jgi:hypothetical protein
MIRECEIKGYEGYYKVSPSGEVCGVDRFIKSKKSGSRKMKGKTIKPFICHNGYPKVNLSLKGSVRSFFVHRLVAEAFIGSKPDGDFQVNHKDGIKTNNNVENLEWISRSDNQIHAINNGLRFYKDTRKRDIEIKRIYALGELNATEIGAMFSLSQVRTSEIIAGSKVRVTKILNKRGMKCIRHF